MTSPAHLKRLRRHYNPKEPYNLWKQTQPRPNDPSPLDAWDAGKEHGARAFARWLQEVEAALVAHHGFIRPLCLDPVAWVEYWADECSSEDAAREDMGYA